MVKVDVDEKYAAFGRVHYGWNGSSFPRAL
jgi:hypothetical protein